MVLGPFSFVDSFPGRTVRLLKTTDDPTMNQHTLIPTDVPDVIIGTLILRDRRVLHEHM